MANPYRGFFKDPERQNVRLVSLWFGTVGILLFVISSLWLAELESWRHLGESLGAALFVLGVVSLLLETRDFVDYTSWVLKQQLLDSQYIKKLGLDELRALKANVDERILGASELTSKGGFYAFVVKNTEDVLRMPYRRDMTDASLYSLVPGRPEFIRRDTVTRYCFIKGYSPGQPMLIRWGGECVEIDHTCNSLIDLLVVVGNSRFKYTNDGPDKFTLRNEGNDQQITVRLSKKTVRENLIFNCYSFEYAVPGSEGFAPDQEVFVEIHDSVIVPSREDDTYYLRLTYPTKHLIVQSVFPDGVTTHAHVFGFTDLSRQPLVQGANVAMVVIEDWSMPGNGAYVSWKLPADWDARAARPAVDPAAQSVQGAPSVDGAAAP